MKISNLGPTKATSSTSRKKKTSSAGEGEFADELRDSGSAGPASAPVDSQTVGAVESILSVQEVPDATEERSRAQARDYGEAVLDRLEVLRRDILLGAISKEKLAELARTLRAQRSKSDDPRLNAILDEIELRAKVEIAKLTR